MGFVVVYHNISLTNVPKFNIWPLLIYPDFVEGSLLTVHAVLTMYIGPTYLTPDLYSVCVYFLLREGC